jgi:hypothetical protein
MSKTIYYSKAFSLTEFHNGKNQSIQISQNWDYIKLTKSQVCQLINKLKDWIDSK